MPATMTSPRCEFRRADDTQLAKLLDDIESQMDSTVPYYVPRLIAELRARLNLGGR